MKVTDIAFMGYPLTDIDPNWQLCDNGPSIALEVDDFDGMMKHLKENGITICVEKIDTSVCEIGTFQDSEGNMITIHSKKATHPENLKATPSSA